MSTDLGVHDNLGEIGPQGPETPARESEGTQRDDVAAGRDVLDGSTLDEQLALTSDWGSSRRRRATGPRLGPVGWLRWVWRQLTSMRTALFLLLLLALAAIPGSVLPQRPSDPLAVNAWIEANPGPASVLDRLGLFDVFASAWFAAIYILLFLSLVGCVLPRIAVHWRSMPRAVGRWVLLFGWSLSARPEGVLLGCGSLELVRVRVQPNVHAEVLIASPSPT